MARSLIDIQNSIIDTIKNQNVTYDTDKGPIYDCVIAPLRDEIEQEELSVDDLRRLLTYRFSDAITDEEAEAFAANFGISRPEGRVSKGKGVFYVYARPTEDLPAERGSGLTTSNDLYDFITSEEKYMYYENIDAYYNADTGRYELPVNIESVGSGFAYELPAGNINKITYGATAWDGFESTTVTTGSSEEATNAQLVDLVRSQFVAQNDTAAWLENLIVQQFPSVIQDVQIVYSKDRELFQRAVTRPAIDVYIYGSEATNEDQTFTATGGETAIFLDKIPVLSVSDVYVNNNSVSFTYVEPQDTLYKSARANSYISLDTALSAGDYVKVDYAYDNILFTLQQLFDNPDYELMFGTDVLFRQFNTVLIDIALQVKVGTDYNTVYTKGEISNLVNDFVDDSARVDFILPMELKELISQNVTGAKKVSLPVFRRNSGYYSESEPIELNRTEMAELNTLNIYTYTG